MSSALVLFASSQTSDRPTCVIHYHYVIRIACKWAACYINSLWRPPPVPSIHGILAPPHPSQGHCNPSIDWAPVDIIHRCSIPRAPHSDRGERVPGRWSLWRPPVTCPTVNFEVRCSWPGNQHSAEVLSHAHHASSSGIVKQNCHIGLILSLGDIIWLRTCISNTSCMRLKSAWVYLSLGFN